MSTRTKPLADKIQNPFGQNDDPDHQTPDSNQFQKGSIHVTPSLSSSSLFQIPDIDMIKVQPVTYTSLKDLLVAASPPAIASPTTPSSSYHDISIKNPLVKQAALAYLQPVGSLTEIGEEGLFGKLGRLFQCGCVEWFNGIVLGIFGRRGGGGDEEEEEEEEDDDGCDEEVD